MRIRKYDFDYGRRELLARGSAMLGAGLLAPMWPLVAKGADISKAYPDELLSVDVYTKGAIKTGDMVDANNVDHVKNLLTPVQYMQVKTMGRRFKIVPTTTDVSIPARASSTPTAMSGRLTASPGSAACPSPTPRAHSKRSRT